MPPVNPCPHAAEVFKALDRYLIENRLRFRELFESFDTRKRGYLTPQVPCSSSAMPTHVTVGTLGCVRGAGRASRPADPLGRPCVRAGAAAAGEGAAAGRA